MSNIRSVCSRCKGDGHIPEYNHHCDGVCFQCKGSGEPRSGSVKEVDVKKVMRVSTLGTLPAHPGLEVIFKKRSATLGNFERTLEFFRRLPVGEFHQSIHGGFSQKLWWVDCYECKGSRMYSLSGTVSVECRRCNAAGILWIPKPKKVVELANMLLYGATKSRLDSLIAAKRSLSGDAGSIEDFHTNVEYVTHFAAKVNTLHREQVKYWKSIPSAKKGAWQMLIRLGLRDLVVNCLREINGVLEEPTMKAAILVVDRYMEADE